MHDHEASYLNRPKMASHHLGLLLLILGFGCCPCSCNPPRLNVTKEFVVDTRKQNSMSIHCEGVKPLHWNWTTMLQPGHEAVSITEDLHPNTDFPYVSILSIKEPFIEDTGFYYCYYEGASNFVTDLANVASTYAYVFNGENGLVLTGANTIHVTTANKLILDCRTTLPNITVHLQKDGQDISSSGQVQWDPKIGFVLRNLAVQNSGLYECRAADYAEESIFVVQVEPEATAVPKPAITVEPNQHFVVGYEFKINCNVILDRDVAFHWTLPNPNAEYTVSSSIAKRKNEDRIGTLHVFNATKEDTGEYTCKVTASEMSPNEDTKFIRIEETLDSYINITSVSTITITEGDPLGWKAGVRAFPPNPMIIYRDWSGKEIEESERVMTEHNINNAESWLKINKTNANDFGNYSIEAILEGSMVKASHTVFIKVKSKPYATLHGVPDTVEAGKPLELSCAAMGYPLGNISWAYRTCPNGQLACDAKFEGFMPEPTDESKPPPGNIKNITIPYQPQESGLLQCRAVNEHGETHEIKAVRLSDIGGNFVFRHTGEGVSTDFSSKKNYLNVIVNDEGFHLLCGGTKFTYKDVALTTADAGLNTAVNETKFTRKSEVEALKVTPNLAGIYNCSATLNGAKTPDTRELLITVLEEKQVTFMNANMRPEGNSIPIRENEPLYLNCTVSGTPSPKISWFKDGEPLLPNNPLFNNETVFLSGDLQRIHFKYVFKENEGTYKCSAENRLNKIEGYLTITAPSASLSRGGKAGLAIACFGIALLVIVVVYLVRRVKRERKFRKSFRQNELFLFEKGNIGQLNTDCTADEQAELLPYDPAWEINRNDITIGKQLGAGAFGRVVKAVVTGLEEDKPKTTVALKMCKSNADQSQVRSLALELKIMIHLGKHLNIVNLMGASTVNIGKGELWILVEYCRYGNLLSFMHRHRNRFVNQIDPITGKIDLLKNYPDAVSPLSPASSGPRGYRTAPILDQDGYLAPAASKFNLASPPNKRNSTKEPQSPISVTGSSNGSFRSDGGSRQIVDNPMYSIGLERSVSVNPEGEPVSEGKQRLNSVTTSEVGGEPADSSSHSDSSKKKRLLSTALSETGSSGYPQENLQVVNTDMTTVTPIASLLSPLSPTDSNHTSDMGLDSSGNPFHYDTGIVPAVTAPFTTSDLVCWAWQVAQGMDYLSRRKVLHGDLAARNLLLADDNVVKISDFGLSREMYKKDVYMKKGDDLMPIKWMAVEAIRDRIFSVQSDVWAYGVTLWELFTLGSTPYPGIEVNKDFLTLLEKGYRMDRPKYANKEMYDILLSCWESNPKDRPPFTLCAERLGVLMLPDLKGHYMTMNDPYLRMNEERFRNETDYLNMLASPNFENLTKDEEANVHYVNIGDAADGGGSNHYLNMKSPNVVGYSRVGMNPDVEATPKSHYLPMGSAQSDPSPMVDVFSPRPNEIPRFNFGEQGQEAPEQLADIPEKEESSSQVLNRDDDLATEKSSLINSDSAHSSRENITDDVPFSSSNDKLHSEENAEDNSVAYINLPTHGTDYVNL